MAQGFYETWARGLRVPWVGDYIAGLAAVCDRLREWGQRAVYLHLPEYSSDDSQALALNASERQIEPGPSEAAAALATRLTTWLQQAQQYGSPLGLLVALYYAEFQTAAVVQQNGVGWTLNAAPVLADLTDPLAPLPSWCTRTVLANANPPIPLSTDGKAAIAANTVPWSAFADGGPMDAAGNQFNSRFAVLFPAITLDGGASWTQPVDLTVAANLARVRRVIARSKPAKASCGKIVVVATGYVYGWPPTTVYAGAGITYGGSSTTYTP